MTATSYEPAHAHESGEPAGWTWCRRPDVSLPYHLPPALFDLLDGGQLMPRVGHLLPHRIYATREQALAALAAAQEKAKQS